MEDRKTLIKIAHYYYNIGMTQDEIGKKLLMSRQKVNRIVNSLVDKGIVTIKINGYNESYIELEEKLERHFGLQEVIITSSEENEEKVLLNNVYKSSANYIEKTISDNDIIGVSWGITLSKTILNLNNTKRKNISIVQIVGGSNLKDPTLKADEITRTMANKFNGIPYLMYAPAIVKDEKFKEEMMNEESMKNIFSIVKQCTVAIVGIGNLSEDSTIYTENYVTKEELKKLKENKFVGDICLQAYTVDGKVIPNCVSDRVIGISINQLKNIPKVVGIASGKEKAKAILGALNGGLIDVLITDNLTAEKILSIM